MTLPLRPKAKVHIRCPEYGAEDAVEKGLPGGPALCEHPSAGYVFTELEGDEMSNDIPGVSDDIALNPAQLRTLLGLNRGYGVRIARYEDDEGPEIHVDVLLKHGCMVEFIRQDGTLVSETSVRSEFGRTYTKPDAA